MDLRRIPLETRKATLIPERERGWSVTKLLGKQRLWRYFQSKTSEAFGSFWGDVAELAKDRLNGCMMEANKIKKGGPHKERRRSRVTLEIFSGVCPLEE